jgi:hypothetical protein
MGDWINPKTLITTFVGIAVGVVAALYLTGSAALKTQTDPSVSYLDMGASNKGVYLAVWTDQRDGNNDIVGAIIQPRTTNVKSNFPLTVASGSQANVKLAANTTNKEFLVVWQDQRNGAFRDIYAQRVRYDGSLIGGNFAISTAIDDQTDPTIAYNAKKNIFLVIWQDYRNSGSTKTDLYGQRVAHDGKLLGGNFVINKYSANSYQPNITYSSTNNEFMLVWQDDRSPSAVKLDIYGQRLNSDGKAIGNEFVISSGTGDKSRPSVAYNIQSKVYLVAWDDKRQFSSNKTDVYGQMVTATGSLAGGNFAISATTGYQIVAAVESALNDFLVCFSDTRNYSQSKTDIYAQRISVSGKAVGNPIGVSNQADDQDKNSVAYAGRDNSYLVVWKDWRNLNTSSMDIYGQHIDNQGVLLKTDSKTNFLISVPAVSGKLTP